MNLRNSLVDSISSNKEIIERLIGYLASKGTDENDPAILDAIPESLEVLRYQAWGLRHANMVFNKGVITFDDIDVKAIAGVDETNEALAILGFSEDDTVPETWLIESLTDLNEVFQSRIESLSKFIMENFGLSQQEMEQVKNQDATQHDQDEIDKVKSIFK